MDDELRLVLLTKDETKAAEKDAKKDQKLISDIEAQKTVLELGSVYWKAVNEFVVSKKIKITADQMKALKYAMKIPVQFPSAYQSVQLLALLEEAKSNGFKA